MAIIDSMASELLVSEIGFCYSSGRSDAVGASFFCG